LNHESRKPARVLTFYIPHKRRELLIELMIKDAFHVGCGLS